MLDGVREAPEKFTHERARRWRLRLYGNSSGNNSVSDSANMSCIFLHYNLDR